jgi:hypothetical protein
MSKFVRWTTAVIILAAMALLSDITSAADKTTKPAQSGAAKSKPAKDAAADRQDDFADLADDAAADKAGKAKAAADKRAAAKAKKADAARAKKESRAAKAAKAKADADAEEQEMLKQMQQAQSMQQQNMRGRRGGLSNNQGMFMLMRQFDADGNGQLDPQEMQAMKLGMAQMQAGGGNLVMAQQLQRFDANGNGQLDPSEQAAMQRALTQGMNGGIGGGGGVVPGAGLPKNQ